MKGDCFTHFKKDISGITLPQKFTFPFYYDPHPLALMAANELKDYLLKCKQWENSFGLQPNPEPMDIGKMFGVLVVKDQNNNIGYLRAFSGKIIDTSMWDGFVPPLFDVYEKGNRFIEGSKKLTAFSDKIEELKQDQNYHFAKQALDKQIEHNNLLLAKEKERLKEARKKRQSFRIYAEPRISQSDFERLKAMHNQESLNFKFMLREYATYLNLKLNPLQQEVDKFNDEITKIKNERKALSMDIQQWLFDHYNFLNVKGEKKNVVDIFKKTIMEVPPSGAGDCAAPKLLQYAFENKLVPIALAEFWWGKSAPSQVRHHGHFYPSCRGKCEPILSHMLSGMDVDTNPMLNNPAVGKTLKIVFEDDYIVIVNKPAEFLSVPGKNITDSVQERMKKKYPDSTGPLIVHRLDMSTSGLLVVAKEKDIHKQLQEQFIKRHVTKRYVALLDGNIKGDLGFIDLPLRVDLDNRPCQLVCFEHGKASRTKWEVIERRNDQTKVHFYPITGRTHQLRVHAAHFKGLNAPIVGDDLYGVKKDRLHLHAESISFDHPVTKERVEVSVGAEF
ncbi:MAG: RluA family pseudouridine synthase [Saprospiraceae bacterium]|nr:RluA family pseudouridine synthase [Saprospiraceae bacterium]